MSPRELTAFRLPQELLDAMRAYKERQGVPVTTQIEKAVTEWLKKRGVVVNTKRKPRKAASGSD